MKLRPSLFSLVLLALLWGTAAVQKLQAATITLIDGMTATAWSPNFVHSELFWIQALDPALASRASGRMAAAYFPLGDRSGSSRETLSNLVKYRQSGPSPALARSTDQLAVSPSFSFVSIAVADNGDVLGTAPTLPDSFPLGDLNPGPAPALPETPEEEDPPSAYIMLAACLLALAIMGWRRSRDAGSI